MRNTVQRTEILNILRARRHHYTASEVYDLARQKIPGISLGTVYRNLGQLCENGEVMAVQTADKRLLYDGFSAPHSHFVCRMCNEIYDLPYTDGDSGRLRGNGFSVSCVHTVYYGICPDCRADGAGCSARENTDVKNPKIKNQS